MKTLCEADIVRLMREEWDLRLRRLLETTGLSGKDPDLISPGLKVRHKESGLRYTVDSVGKEDVILLTPEGDRFLLDREELQEYELD